MNAIPAKVAGVARIVMVVPTPDGVLNPLVLAAATIAGVDEIYRIGGAQAVAALAYGTATIAPVDKIVGPGQRLCRGRQAPGVRRGRHRHDRRPVGDPGRRRRRERSGLDRRRSACRRPSTTPAAQSILITDDAALRRRRGGARSKASSRACRAPTSRGELARPRRHHPGRRLSTAPRADRPARARASRARDGAARGAGRPDAPSPARSSSAATRPRRSATMSPAPTTCCRPRAARASPPASASSIS